jgi:hypothetical protein
LKRSLLEAGVGCASSYKNGITYFVFLVTN